MILSVLIALWLVAALVQLHYWLVVIWPLATHRSRITGNTEPVSVIICTNRRNDNLRTLVNSILAQEYVKFELIVVDDSRQEVPLTSVLDVADDRFRVIRYMRQPGEFRGKKGPLAFGIRHARYPWLLLTDDDCQVHEGWIAGMMQYASGQRRLVLGYAPLISRGGLAGLLSSFDTLMIGMQYFGFARRARTYMGVGRNILYHRNLYDAVGGFADHGEIPSGDDDLFVQAAAGRTRVTIALDPVTFAPSDAKRSVSGLIRQKRRHISTSWKYKPARRRQLAVYAAGFIAFWLFGPFTFIGGFQAISFIFLIIALTQWTVFAQVARRMRGRRFAATYPLHALLHAVFLTVLGAMSLLRKHPETWS